MEYYSVMRKKEILPFAITWIKLEGIMLGEIIIQRKTNIGWYHLYKESKKPKLIETQCTVEVTRG